MVCCNLFRDKPQYERFERVEAVWKALAAGQPFGFSNDVFLAERDTADRNYCLVYMMKEAGSLPKPGPSLDQDLNLYLSLCSLQAHCEQLSIVAATLANWGVNPFTNERVFSTETVKSCLSLMTSTGLYDSSATFQASLEFALPAKSGVSGALMVVVPGKFGLCTFAPPLDETGNSVFGLEFCRLFTTYLGSPKQVSNLKSSHQLHRLLLHACGQGNLNRVVEIVANGIDVNACDFDLRTPLHVAVANGHAAVCRLLLLAGAVPTLLDRFGKSPIQEADDFPEIQTMLLKQAGLIEYSGDTSSEHSDDQEQVLQGARMLAEVTHNESSESSLHQPTPRLASRSAHNDVSMTGPITRVVSRGDVYRYVKEELLFSTATLADDDFLLSRYLLALASIAFEPVTSQNVLESICSMLDKYGLGHLNRLLPAQLADESPEQYLQRACLQMPILGRALEGKLAIPDWKTFSLAMDEMLELCKRVEPGLPAKYSAVLARAKPTDFGVCFCSVDGQIYTQTTTSVVYEVSLQSCFKPFAFAMALAAHGDTVLAKYVGNEPSGKPFNHIGLNRKNLPYNPMVNAGGLTVCSLIEHSLPQRDRFKLFSDMWQKMTGVPAKFSQDIFLAEMLASDRNMAIAHLLKSAKAFPPHLVSDPAQIIKVVEFYSILCSVTCTMDQVALAAACLANAGISVHNGEQVFSPAVTRKVLSLMLSAGCAEDSGWLQFTCGFPVKTGASGLVMGVLPGLGGFAVTAPGINQYGNSIRGLEFCSQLAKRYSVHMFEKRVGLGRRNPAVWSDDDLDLTLESLFW